MQATNKQIKSTAAISQNQKQVIINLEALLGGVQNSIDCLIVLNSEKEKQLLPKLVSAAKNIIIADGGANYFYLSTSKDSPKLRCIIGDFDSIQDHVKQYFQKKGVNVCHDNDQDSTDLDKALKRAFNEGYKNIVCLGAFGGRMDHTLSALSVTSRINREYANTHIVLIGGANLMTLLRPKQHYRLRISDKIVTKSGNGLITFSKAQNIETTGFKWNLGTKHGLTELEWGKFLSTSNQILEKELTIYSSQELFFICQLKHQSGPFTKL